MGIVTIRNYNFPILFSYKGWKVEITDNTGLRQEEILQTYDCLTF